MHLGIVTPQLCQYGGAEIYLLECVKRWQKELQLTIYTPAYRRALLKEFGIGAQVQVVQLPTSKERQGLLYNTLVLPRLWEQRLGRHDLYFLYLFPTHFITRRPSVWFAAEPLRMLYDLRQYHHPTNRVNVHFYPRLHYDHVQVSEIETFLHLIEKIDATTTFDRFVTNSSATGRYLHTVYRREPDAVVYPGVNVPIAASPLATTGPLLSVGNLWRHKRVDLILRALAWLPQHELIVVGRGPEKRALRQLARHLGVHRRVHFHGRVQQATLQELYAQCSLCVYTPAREPFGMVPLEAAAAGKPLVVTEGSGCGEVLDASCARFVPPQPEQIAQAIQEIATQPELARRMGAAGRAIAEQYTWDRTAATLLQLFRDTVGPRKCRQTTSPATLLGAHYYPWYQAEEPPRHWNENREFATVTDFPRIGPYTSHDEHLLQSHLRQVLDAGIDFLVVNWQVTFRGVDPVEVTATRKLFAEVERHGYPLSLAILLAVNTESMAEVLRALTTVREQFMPSPVYHRFHNRPLIWYYLSGYFLGMFFYHYHDLLRMHHDCYAVATGQPAYHKFLPQPLKRFFSGWCLYSPLQVGPAARWEALWTGAYRDYWEDGGTLRVFTICPGYDDRGIVSAERAQSQYRSIARDATQTYQRMQRVALELNPAPHLVVVTSFNEFHENTHIEPSQQFGDLYLKSTQAFKEALQAK